MRNLGLGIIGLIGMTAAAQAATPAPPKAPAAPANACFDVVPNAGAGAPADAILVNRCTGETWLLAREPVPDSNGENTGGFTYIWEPLTRGHDQPVLELASPKTMDD